MDIRSRLNTALKTAMKERQSDRLSTLRLINAAIKDRDIAARGSDDAPGEMSEADLLQILGRMGSSARKASAPTRRAAGWNWPMPSARKSR